MVEKRGGEYLSKNLPLLREDLRNISKTEAANRFIRQVATLPVEHSTHLYKLKRAKDEPLGTAWLGICPRGIQIYEVSSAVGAWRDCPAPCHRSTPPTPPLTVVSNRNDMKAATPFKRAASRCHCVSTPRQCVSICPLCVLAQYPAWSHARVFVQR